MLQQSDLRESCSMNTGEHLITFGWIKCHGLTETNDSIQWREKKEAFTSPSWPFVGFVCRIWEKQRGRLLSEIISSTRPFRQVLQQRMVCVDAWIPTLLLVLLNDILAPNGAHIICNKTDLATFLVRNSVRREKVLHIKLQFTTAVEKKSHSRINLK